MQSGGFNTRNGIEGSSKNAAQTAGRTVKAAKGAGRALKKAAKRVGRAVKNTSKNAAKAVFNSLPLPIKIIVIAALFIAFTVLVYHLQNSDGGKTDNYVDYGNAVVSDGQGGFTVAGYSNANAACKAYYGLLSKNRSVYQETDRAGGKTELILMSDKDAVRDYFKNDGKFYIEGDLLFAMNKFVFSETFVFPEAFLKPVAYDKETYELLPVMENGELALTTDKNGLPMPSVADYGIASVLSYEKHTLTRAYRGVYTSYDYINENGDLVRNAECSESYEIVSESREEDCLKAAVTYRGAYHYGYVPCDDKIAGIYEGTCEDEASNASRVVYATAYANVYFAEISYGGRVAFDTLAEAEAFCEAYPSFSVVTDAAPEGSGVETEGEDAGVGTEGEEAHPAEDKYDGRIPHTEKREVKLYKSRDVENSGEYETFVRLDASVVNNEEEMNNDYLYDYLTHFSTYKPKNISHSYETLRRMRSQAAMSNYFSSVSQAGTGYTGSNAFDDAYSANRENVLKIWDGLIQYGYSEPQAAAILGNMCVESRCNPAAVNPTSLAFGIMQIYPEGNPVVYSKLLSLAASRGVGREDLETQIMFAAMSSDMDRVYSQAPCQWLYQNTEVRWSEETVRQVWNTSNDAGILGRTYRLYLERGITLSQWTPTEPDTLKGEKAAIAAYETLHGRIIEYPIDVIAPDGGTAGGDGSSSAAITRGNLTAEDFKTFTDFYNTFDISIYENGNIEWEYYSFPLTRTQALEVFYTANMYLLNTDIETQRRRPSDKVLNENYLSDLTDRATRTIKRRVMAGRLDSPRLSAEGTALTYEEVYENPYYTSYRGGYSPYFGSIGLDKLSGDRGGNCTAYAWGRFSEIMGEPMQGGNYGDGGQYYDNAVAYGIYETGQVPEVGAIVSWSNSGAGHVAVIEVINPDGSIVVSQSGWNSRRIFWNDTYASPEAMINTPYGHLEGYIYPRKK